jgi:beta-phosphoglucomutase-like phosphatase (HAD superfamily)
MNVPAFRNAIWDLDGTLFDTYPAICRAFQEALADCGASATLAEIESLCLVEVSHCAAVLAARFDLNVDAFIGAFGKQYIAISLPIRPFRSGVYERMMAAGGCA